MRPRAHPSWVHQAHMALARFLGHFSHRWYTGRAGRPIKLDISDPRANPFARGYAEWLAEGPLIRPRPLRGTPLALVKPRPGARHARAESPQDRRAA